MGYNTVSNGNFSSSLGYYTISNYDYCVTIGKFNKDYAPISQELNEPIFSIGIGDENERKDGKLFIFFHKKKALVVIKNGALGVNCYPPEFSIDETEKLIVNGNIRVIGNAFINNTNVFESFEFLLNENNIRKVEISDLETIIKNNFSKLNENYETLNGNFSIFKKKINDVEIETSENKGNISELNSEIISLKKNVKIIFEEIGDINDTLDEFNRNSSLLNQKVEGVYFEIEEIKTRLKEQNESISESDKRIQILENEVIDINDKINEIENNVNSTYVLIEEFYNIIQNTSKFEEMIKKSEIFNEKFLNTSKKIRLINIEIVNLSDLIEILDLKVGIVDNEHQAFNNLLNEVSSLKSSVIVLYGIFFSILIIFFIIFIFILVYVLCFAFKSSGIKNLKKIGSEESTVSIEMEERKKMKKRRNRNNSNLSNLSDFSRSYSI